MQLDVLSDIFPTAFPTKSLHVFVISLVRVNALSIASSLIWSV
jgi:hypothetical protein